MLRLECKCHWSGLSSAANTLCRITGLSHCCTMTCWWELLRSFSAALLMNRWLPSIPSTAVSSETTHKWYWRWLQKTCWRVVIYWTGLRRQVEYSRSCFFALDVLNLENDWIRLSSAAYWCSNSNIQVLETGSAKWPVSMANLEIGRCMHLMWSLLMPAMIKRCVTVKVQFLTHAIGCHAWSSAIAMTSLELFVGVCLCGDSLGVCTWEPSSIKTLNTELWTQ